MTAEPFPPAKRSRPSTILFIGFNIVRFFSIVSMLMIFASQINGCVKDVKAVKQSSGTSDEYECDYIEFSSVPDQAGGLFWCLLNRIFILILIPIILLPEIHIPTTYLQTFYSQNIPILSPAHGLGLLGVVQCWISSVVLGKYVERYEQATGWIGFIVGCLNVVIGVVWRTSAKEKRKIFSWENVAQLTPQTKVAYATYKTAEEKYDKYGPMITGATNYVLEKHAARTQAKQSSQQATMVKSEEAQEASGAGYVEPELRQAGDSGDETGPGGRFGGFGFGKQKEKKSGFLEISRPVQSLPRYASAETLRRPSADV